MKMPGKSMNAMGDARRDRKKNGYPQKLAVDFWTGRLYIRAFAGEPNKKPAEERAS